MSILYELPNYTSEQLENAKKLMTRSEAYSLVTRYYIVLNYKKEAEKGRISNQQYVEYQNAIKTRTSSELEERQGYKKNLGAELLPTTDSEYENKLRQALFIVDDDFRNGKGNTDFMARFASVLPKPFLNMVFILAINNQNEDMINAIQSNGTEAFLEFDELLKKEYPQLRLKAINSGVVYPSTLLDYAEADINNGEGDFTRAADIFALLEGKLRANYDLFLKLKHGCFDLAQERCTDIAQYQNNKKIFFEKVLKLKPGLKPNLSEIMGNMPKEQLENSSYQCPMEYATTKFSDLLLFPESSEPINLEKNLKQWANTIIDIDIDERWKAVEKKFRTQKEQPIKRSTMELGVIDYANRLIREDITDVEKAKAYLRRHKRGDINIVAPNPMTMKMIMEKFGNSPQIKELLFDDVVGLNHLWDAIPFDSIPKEYTIYEKMIAGSQILANDIFRINEIPEDVRKKIFDSKDCITRILFPGLNDYAEFKGIVGKLQLGFYSRGINPNILLTRVLGMMSSRLKAEGYLQEIKEMYKDYRQFGSNPYTEKLDWDTINYLIDLNEVPVIPRPLFKPYGLEEIDTTIELESNDSINEVGAVNYDSKVYSPYSPKESAQAKEMLTIPESIQILQSYYEMNKYLITAERSKKIYDFESDEYLAHQAIDKSRLLAQEISLLGRGELLRLAARNVDEMLFTKKPISPEDLNLVKDFAEKCAPYMPEEFLISFNRVLSIMGQKTIGMDFNTDRYQRIAKECRKYVCSKAFRENATFDSKDLADCISKIYVGKLDKGTLPENDFLYLLYAMVACYDKVDFDINFKNYNSLTNKSVPNEIERATDKAIQILFDSGMVIDNVKWNIIISGHKTSSSMNFFPLHTRMIGKLMERMYNSKCQEEERRSSEPNKSVGEKIRTLLSSMIVSDDRRKNVFFRNINPDEFLKWDAMDEDLLERALVIMGRNDVEVLQILDAIDQKNGNALIRLVNDDLSEERIEEFKERLIRVKNSIFNSKDTKNIVALFEPDEDFTLLPNHKQPVNAYLYEIQKLMAQEQINSDDVRLALFNDCNSDFRVAQLSPQKYKRIIDALLSQMPTQKEKDASQKENPTTTDHVRNHFEDS